MNIVNNRGLIDNLFAVKYILRVNNAPWCNWQHV